jgi:hypothetical protein
MEVNVMRMMLITVAVLLAVVSAWADEPTHEPADPVEVKVTIEASTTPVADVLADIAKQSKETILLESLVSGNVTATVKDSSMEKALDVVTKALGLQWRKIQVPQGSVLAKDANALAAQMRTVLSLRFPDLIISPEGAGGSFIHVQRELSANQIMKAVPPAAGFVTVYLVTDDRKAYEKELKDESRKKVAKYVDGSRELMEMFLEMSPEERQAVMRESMNMMTQMDPAAMQEMMTSMFEQSPDYIMEMNRMGMEAMLGMSPEARRNMLRMSMRQQMELMNSMPPEFMQMLQEEAMAIAAEMMNESTIAVNHTTDRPGSGPGRQTNA